jgi:hypothetical protein
MNVEVYNTTIPCYFDDTLTKNNANLTFGEVVLFCFVLFCFVLFCLFQAGVHRLT